jgi:type I restriction enzyme S subunit
MTVQGLAGVSGSIDLPAGWSTKALRELCLKTSLVDPVRVPDREFEYVDVSSVSADRLSIVGTARVKGPAAPSRARKLLQAGDVIFATVRPTLRRVALVPPNLAGQLASTAFCVIRANPDLADSRFLYYAAITEDFIKRVGALERGASYPAVTESNVMDQEMAVPSLPEQRAIARVLSKLQAVVEVQHRIVATLKQLKAATMTKLFREGLRGEPLKQTEIGEIPESWEVVQLGDLCKPPNGFIQTGPFGSQLHASDYVADGIPIVNPAHLTETGIDRSEVPRIPRSDVERLERHQVRLGDILFSRRGDVGRHAPISQREVGWVCGTGCLLVRAEKAEIDPLYLSHYLCTTPAQKYVKSQAVGTIMPNINTRILSTVPVALPSREDQHAISNLMTTLAERAALAHAILSRLRGVFELVLRRLMTGELRVQLEAPEKVSC